MALTYSLHVWRNEILTQPVVKERVKAIGSLRAAVASRGCVMAEDVERALKEAEQENFVAAAPAAEAQPAEDAVPRPKKKARRS